MRRWATMHNLKQMAGDAQRLPRVRLYFPGRTGNSPCRRPCRSCARFPAKLKTLETRLAGKKELQRQVLAFAKTKPVRDGLKAQKSEKARTAYRQAHESEFIIADAAARYFREHGISKLPARKALQAEIEGLIVQKDGLYQRLPGAERARPATLQTVKSNIDQILRREEPRRRKEQSHER